MIGLGLAIAFGNRRLEAMLLLWIKPRNGNALAMKVEPLHGDRMGRAAGRAQTAADTGGFVFQHHRTKAVELRAIEIYQLRRRHCQQHGNLLASFLRAAEFRQSGQPDQILGTNIHASRAGHADLRIEYGIDVATLLQ